MHSPTALLVVVLAAFCALAQGEECRQWAPRVWGPPSTSCHHFSAPHAPPARRRGRAVHHLGPAQVAQVGPQVRLPLRE